MSVLPAPPEPGEPARFDPAALPVLADAIRRTAHLVPPSAAEVIEVLGDEVVDDLVVTITLVVPDELDPHAVTRTEYDWGVAWLCACGRWEAVATGPSSTAFAARDHARHRAAEEAASGGE